MLWARGLSFHRAGRAILQDVDLAVFPGERVGLVGPSGAGKTTLLRLLSGLDQPTAGQVGGQAGGGIGPAAGSGTGHRDGVRVGLLFQDLGLFPHMRVRSNVAFPLLARRVPRAERRRRALAALDQAGLAGHAERFPGALSGGEQQRVALIRTLLSEPAVVLLDEPFAALDPHLVDQFVDWLSQTQARTGVPMTLVTHDVRFAMRWADRLVMLVGGRVVQSGPPEAVYARPATEFVATFLGRATVLDAEVVQVHDNVLRCRTSEIGGLVTATAGSEFRPGQACRLVLRPHHLSVAAGRESAGEGQTGEAQISAELTEVEFSGASTELVTRTAAGTTLRASVPAGDGRWNVGDPVALRWPPTAAHAVAP